MSAGAYVQDAPRVILSEPALTVIGALLVECQGHRLIGLVVPVVMDFGETLEPLTRLLLRARAQPLVVFQIPGRRRRCTEPVLPAVKLAGGIEGNRLAALRRLQERSGE